jgi:transposase
LVSALVLATIGDPLRFESRNQVLKLAGLDLNASRSGKRSSQAVPVITKRGNANFRYALFQAAMIASFRNDRLRALFNHYLEGRIKECGIKTKMRVKLAAKLLAAAWAMMKNGTPFDPGLIEL